MIIIYQDYVHNSGSLHRHLVQQFGHEAVRYADASDILDGILTPSVRAFVMPGGASRYVADKLNGQGNQLIRSYVENGGVYIGVCAGAYYACRRTEWRSGHDDAISVDNELAFFPGVAKGPVAEFTNPAFDMDHTASYADLAIDGQVISVFYRGGPSFHADIQNDNSYETPARYAGLPGNPPAIITGDVGKGRYLLCSPHLEINPEQLALIRFNVKANRYKDIAALPDTPILDKDYFASLLARFIG